MTWKQIWNELNNGLNSGLGSNYLVHVLYYFVTTYFMFIVSENTYKDMLCTHRCYWRHLDRTFLSCLSPPCQNEFSLRTIHVISSPPSSFSCRSKLFSEELFCTQTRFETDSQGKSEISYNCKWWWLWVWKAEQKTNIPCKYAKLFSSGH